MIHIIIYYSIYVFYFRYDSISRRIGAAAVSTDNGVTWDEKNNGFPSTYIESFAQLGNKLFAAGYNGVFETTNNGAQWDSSGLNAYIVNTLFTIGTTLFAGIDGGGLLVFNGQRNELDCHK